MIDVKRLFLLGIFILVFLFTFSFLAFAQENSNSIILSPEFQELKVNEEFIVEVILNSNSQLVGADAVLSFNPGILEVVSIDEGGIFSKTPLRAIEPGKIKITGVEEDKDKLFSGSGSLAKIKFKAKDAGQTGLDLEFKPGSTTDSNLTTAQAAEVLSEVKNSSFVVGSPLERGTALVRRALVRALPFLIFLIFAGVAGFFGYRWWKGQQLAPKNIFVQRKVPMDKPPTYK